MVPVKLVIRPSWQYSPIWQYAPSWRYAWRRLLTEYEALVSDCQGPGCEWEVARLKKLLMAAENILPAGMKIR